MVITSLLNGYANIPIIIHHEITAFRAYFIEVEVKRKKNTFEFKKDLENEIYIYTSKLNSAFHTTNSLKHNILLISITLFTTILN